MSVLDNFEQWKGFLGERLDQAQGKGLDGGAINDMAYRIGDYLANEVEARNDQEKLLMELWKVADEQEQHTIASLMVKMVKHK
ncbi:DUF3243 domain-containing protein [Bacillus sp. CGMCC 1.60114]|uniref:DUF3243 domain-containing protein n=1 Tax=unclassified Bacillus (in: firmicutes) TaxID=185979 RepID=UPI003641F82E